MMENDIGNARENYGVGNIIIPERVNRDDYINYCKSLEQVCIITENGEFISDVFVLKNIMSELEYPLDHKTLGSQVFYVNIRKHNKPVIIGILSKQGESAFIDEGEFNYFKRIGSNVVQVSGSAKSSTTTVFALGKNSTINIESRGENSQINIKSSSKVKINASEVILTSLNSVLLKVLNIETNKESAIEIGLDGIIKISPELKFKIFEGNSPIPKGDILKTELDKGNEAMIELQNAINSWVPVAGDGGAALKTALSGFLAKVMADYSNINSEKSYTD